ncbi:MAG: cob(I)yrinic acid a,c-diamide adenosyltransferase [Candidatus Eisenbacteria bacterium]|nr:cob(I)yrinic acid a,c-diamide adenosyltransferase [Candidatus Eisenbacteria bacterium]
MKIYTRTGDDGETGLLGPVRVPKDHLRVDAYGEIDELNAHIGAIRSAIEDGAADTLLMTLQNRLFDAGAELARPRGTPVSGRDLSADDVAALEREIDRMASEMPPLREFVIPGGCEAACRAHLARVVCRRAERAVVRLLRVEPGETEVLRYLNRLSDLLFTFARWANARAGVADAVWRGRRP